MVSACVLVLFLTYCPEQFFSHYLRTQKKRSLNAVSLNADVLSKAQWRNVAVMLQMLFLIHVRVYSDLLMLWLTGLESCDLLSGQLKALNAH